MRTFVAVSVFAAAVAGFAASRPAGAGDEPAGPGIRVPYVPTPEPVVAAMLKLAAVKDGETVYDLGCGDGRIVIRAVKEFGAGRGVGIDIEPKRLKDCAARVANETLTADQKKCLTFKQGDVLKMKAEDFKDVDVVALYLMDDVNVRLKPILRTGLRPGARVVSHDFDMGEDWKEDRKVEVKGERSLPHTVYLWVVKGKK